MPQGTCVTGRFSVDIGRFWAGHYPKWLIRLGGASYRRALDALKELDAAGVVRQISEGGYDRQYAADELFDLIERYEGLIAGREASRFEASR
ncbi:MAG TPA: hypothetical protein VNF73_15440 [Candidatus Saccharimonadales bacterium]|nr:hypothetical protein [Candidatus Saccharimonadales bacterium]